MINRFVRLAIYFRSVFFLLMLPGRSTVEQGISSRELYKETIHSPGDIYPNSGGNQENSILNALMVDIHIVEEILWQS